MMSRFWWSGREDMRKIAWVSWDKMCNKKGDGGMGFRRISDFNDALLAKQAWRIIKMPELLSSRMLRARYFPNSSFLKAGVGCRPSFIWRSIWGSKWVIEKGCKWVIGDGKDVRIWENPWLSRPPSYRVISPKKEGCECVVVSDLIDPIGGRWREDLVQECFLPFEAAEVLAIPLSSLPLSDEFFWSYEKTGVYSVKSGYNFINFYKGATDNGGQTSDGTKLWHWIWGLAVPPKVRVFLWRLCNGALPTARGLHRRVEDIPPFCHRCRRMEETS